jgi:hypothetical protein
LDTIIAECNFNLGEKARFKGAIAKLRELEATKRAVPTSNTSRNNNTNNFSYTSISQSVGQQVVPKHSPNSLSRQNQPRVIDDPLEAKCQQVYDFTSTNLRRYSTLFFFFLLLYFFFFFFLSNILSFEFVIRRRLCLLCREVVIAIVNNTKSLEDAVSFILEGNVNEKLWLDRQNMKSKEDKIKVCSSFFVLCDYFDLISRNWRNC